MRADLLVLLNRRPRMSSGAEVAERPRHCSLLAIVRPLRRHFVSILLQLEEVGILEGVLCLVLNNPYIICAGISDEMWKT